MHLVPLATLLVLAAGAAQAAGVQVTETRFGALKALQLEDAALRVKVLPERGANIISVYDKRTKREWMWQNPWDPYKKVPYASRFSDADLSGYDDCFPTIGQQAYPEEPWKGTVLPDHGEVWSLPWEYTLGKDGIRLKVHGVRLPYLFEKEIRLVRPGEISIRYRVTNHAPMPMEAIWAGHALVAARPGMEVFLPAGAKFRDDLAPWTLESAHNLQWIRLGGPETKACKKAFTERLPEGWGGFYDGKTKEYLLYAFPAKSIPYFGLWITQGGMEVRGNAHYNVGLEPTNGGENFLHSRERGMVNTLAARGTQEWEIRMILGTAAKADLAGAVRWHHRS